MTVANIITYAKIAEYLASNAVSNGALYGAQPNPNLPAQIYLILKSVEQRYIDEGSPSTPSASLFTTSEYLWAWLKQYGIQAQGLVNSGGAIPTPGGGGSTIYGRPIQGIYTAATEPETVLDLGLPSDAIVVWAEISILPVSPFNWSWAYPNLTLLNGNFLGIGDIVNYLYVVPIN